MAVELAATEIGGGRPLLILHGLFGSGRNWTTIAKRLAERARVFTLDARNHGNSPWADSMTYPEMAEDVRAFIVAKGLVPAAVMGHSMGGKILMHLALEHPEMVDRLVVVDMAPVAYGHTQLPYVRAMKAVDLSRVSRRGDVDAALAASVPEVGIRAFLLQNLVQEDRRWAWRINLDVIERDMAAIMDFPMPGGMRPFDKPALFLAGAKADYIRPEHHERIRALFPQAVIEMVPDAGHWVHAEKPSVVVERTTAFLG
ncbi:MAG TPA: alpha/beta fold hydrolase [Azospirillaceae bacterium]|nr:alpha/beta fold hydrolase [Azospirillaceae bacterium]